MRLRLIDNLPSSDAGIQSTRLLQCFAARGNRWAYQLDLAENWIHFGGGVGGIGDVHNPVRTAANMINKRFRVQATHEEMSHPHGFADMEGCDVEGPHRLCARYGNKRAEGARKGRMLRQYRINPVFADLVYIEEMDDTEDDDDGDSDAMEIDEGQASSGGSETSEETLPALKRSARFIVGDSDEDEEEEQEEVPALLGDADHSSTVSEYNEREDHDDPMEIYDRPVTKTWFQKMTRFVTGNFKERFGAIREYVDTKAVELKAAIETMMVTERGTILQESDERFISIERYENDLTLLWEEVRARNEEARARSVSPQISNRNERADEIDSSDHGDVPCPERNRNESADEIDSSDHGDVPRFERNRNGPEQEQEGIPYGKLVRQWYGLPSDINMKATRIRSNALHRRRDHTLVSFPTWLRKAGFFLSATQRRKSNKGQLILLPYVPTFKKALALRVPAVYYRDHAYKMRG